MYHSLSLLRSHTVPIYSHSLTIRYHNPKLFESTQSTFRPSRRGTQASTSTDGTTHRPRASPSPRPWA